MDPRLLTGENRTEALDVSRLRAAAAPLPGRIEIEQASLMDMWHTFVKRRWYIIGCAFIITTLTAITSFRATKIYESVGRIAIFRENADPIGFNKNADNGEDWDYNVALDTQVRILKSDRLAVEAARKLLPGESAPEIRSTASDIPNVTPKQRALANRLRGGLTAIVLPRTRVVELRFDDPDPKFAMTAINTLIDSYIELNIKTKFEASVQTSNWLTQQLTEMQLKMETAQEKLVRYQKEYGIIGLDEKTNIITSKLDQLNKELTDAQADRIRKEADYKLVLAGGNVESGAKNSSDNMMTQLRARQAEFQIQYAQLNTRFGPSYPKVVDLRDQLAQIGNQIEEERKRLVTYTNGQYQGALRREQMLSAALEQQKKEANDLNEKAIQYGILKHEADSNRQIYESMLQKLKEAGVSAGLRSSNIRLVDAAQLPAVPVKPNIPRNILLAMFLGLGAGVCLAFVVEALDNTISSSDEAQAIAGLPSLGIVPLGQLGIEKKQPLLAASVTPTGARPRGGMEMVSHMRPHSQMAESYRAIRTSLLLSAPVPPKVVLVTSAMPQEGKTMTSVNSAVVLAQKGLKVLLIDCDLRRPSVAKSLGLMSRGGVSTVLTGRDTLESAIITHPQLENVFVLPSGPIPPHPAELLGSQQMRDLLQSCRDRFDHVIVDSPPVLSVTDAVILSVYADSVMLVLRSGRTTKQALRRARELLSYVGAPSTGLILNAVDLQSPEHYYYYYGKYRSYYASGDAE